MAERLHKTNPVMLVTDTAIQCQAGAADSGSIPLLSILGR